MHLIDATILITVVTVLGSLASVIATSISNRGQKAQELVSERVVQLESRVDSLEDRLAAERSERWRLAEWAANLRVWAVHAYSILRTNGIDIDPPPASPDKSG